MYKLPPMTWSKYFKFSGYLCELASVHSFIFRTHCYPKGLVEVTVIDAEPVVIQHLENWLLVNAPQESTP